MKKELIYVAGDHAGFKYKKEIIKYLDKKGYTIIDMGPNEYNKNDDYPDFVQPLAKKVSKNKKARGIIMAGSGQGEVIAANRIKGARTALCYKYDPKIIKMSREHNNSNILSLGARFMSLNDAKKSIDLWLKHPFSNLERHKRRLKKLEKGR